jgi:hypothetical protein
MYGTRLPVYGCALRQEREVAVEIGRRELLTGAATLGLTTMVGPIGATPTGTEHPPLPDPRWHPLTQSLFDRATRAGQRLDQSRVDRLIREVAGEHGQPVIKWMDSPDRAFEHLRRYPLDELAQMPIAHFWPAPPLGPVQEYAELERSLDLYVLANLLLGVEERCGELLGARLDFRARLIGATPDPAAVFDTEMLAAEIGWIETSLPAVAARAIRAVEDLLSAGRAEGSMEICHQLMVFEAFEHGLLATWETPEELVCLPVSSTA